MRVLQRSSEPSTRNSIQKLMFENIVRQPTKHFRIVHDVMQDFIYIIKTGLFDEQTRYIAKKLEKNGSIITFDTTKTKLNKKTVRLINYIISMYQYIEEDNRIYIRGNYNEIFKNIILFCSKNSVDEFLVYSKNIKNNLLDIDKNNSAFVKIY